MLKLAPITGAVVVSRDWAIHPSSPIRHISKPLMRTRVSYKLFSHVGNYWRSHESEGRPVRRRLRDHVERGRGKRAGDRTRWSPAGGGYRAPWTASASGLGLDAWILPMDGETVCLGGWTLGEPTPASRGVDSWTMGSSRRGVCVDQRILALAGVRAEDLSEGP